MSVVIKVENLTKTYQLGVIGQTTLQEALARKWAKLWGKPNPHTPIGSANNHAWRQGDTIYALQDLNFEVKQGEVLGIIGKNGAGKSTLLKILSKITAPTSGSIKIKGRIASLLEVGTGMHPELTGRENIFLNGAILGMQRAEIRAKLDAIIDFAGIDDYIDTPIKRYSSGMRVRLGFAVAAFLEPEILIVDEVLAVGDAEFQKKAIGKMQDVAQGEGRTVLFVSHNMQAVSTLTTQTMLLHSGKIALQTNTEKVISFYLSQYQDKVKEYTASVREPCNPYIKKVKLHTTYQDNIQAFKDKFMVEFHIYTPSRIESPAISYQIFNLQNISVLHILNLNEELPFCQQTGVSVLKSIIPCCRLYPDKYYLKVHFADKKTKNKLETLENICHFEVKVFEQLRDYYWYNQHAVYVEDSKWELCQ